MLPAHTILPKAIENGLTDPTHQSGAPIMADIFQMQPRDQWQFSCDVIRKPDGKLVAVVVDARGSIVEGDGSPSEKLNSIAKMLEDSVVGLRATAQAVKE